MIEWVVSSCILILAVIALRYLLRGRISLRLQYALWLLVLARLLLPVSFGSTDISVMSVVEKAPAVQAVESVREVDTIWQAHDGSVEGYPAGPLMPDTPVTVAPSVTNDQFSRMESALTLRKLLLPIWWCGAAVTLLVFLSANLRFAGRLRKSRRPLAVEGAALPVYVAEERAVPCLFGLFRPAIYVTQATADDPVLLRHAVAHETTHFRHGDHVWALLRAVCLALHWWNPLVWWAAKLSRQDGELACDEATIRALGETERAAYGRTLIRMACGRGVSPLLTATAMDGGKTSLHERIVLLAKKPRTAALAAIALVLAAALCVGCTFTGAKKEELSGNLGSIAAMMAKLTTDDLSSESVNGYPDIDWEQMVAAINRAAAHEITEEVFLAAQETALLEGENLHYMVSVSVENGHDLLVSCDTVPADIVHVMDPTAALSSVSIPNDKLLSTYFRDHELYELVRQNDFRRDYNAFPEVTTPEVELLPADRLGTLPSRAVLTTQTFTYEDLTLEVTDVYYTGKGLVREDETQVFENNYFVVCPGATFTVVSGGAENDSNGVPHANWKYYDPFGGTVELTPGSGPYEITLNSSIGRDNFPVLLFNQFEGWLQEPAADPVEVVRKAIEADAQKPATLSTRVISAALDETETARIVEMYSDGDLARSRGWTNELLADHFVTVKAVYEAQYDGTKTFLDSGTITEFFYLTQYNDGRWRIVDNGVRSVQR
jgi:beta-lactamase regulating signal transducer with metallopeptidase domain